MNTVSFIVVLICGLIGAIVSICALVQLRGNNPKARGTLVTGFGFWLLGIVLAAVLFGFFSL